MTALTLAATGMAVGAAALSLAAIAVSIADRSARAASRWRSWRSRRVIRAKAAEAVEAALVQAGQHAGDIVAAALLMFGGLYAIGGGLMADALHAAAQLQ